MLRNSLLRIPVGACRSIVHNRYSTKLDIEKLENESAADVEVVDEEAVQREEEIERKRNKSRLRVADRNMLLEQTPYPEPQFWYHGTLKYMRRMYGVYGAQSGVNPSICWPVKEELDESREYERVAHPFTIPQMIEKSTKARTEKEQRMRERQLEIVKRMGQLEHWKQDLKNRIAKKENEVLAAKERKSRLVEEVRAHFGYTVDPKDEKFKELLEKKEKEQKKADKEARRQAREQNMLAKMLSKKAKAEQADKNEST